MAQARLFLFFSHRRALIFARVFFFVFARRLYIIDEHQRKREREKGKRGNIARICDSVYDDGSSARIYRYRPFFLGPPAPWIISADLSEETARGMIRSYIFCYDGKYGFFVQRLSFLSPSSPLPYSPSDKREIFFVFFSLSLTTTRMCMCVCVPFLACLEPTGALSGRSPFLSILRCYQSESIV